MHSSVGRVNIVRETQLFRTEIIHIGEGNFNFHLFFISLPRVWSRGAVSRRIIFLVHVKNFILQKLLAGGQIFYERQNASLKVKSMKRKRGFSFIQKIYAYALGKIRLLSNVVQNSFVAEYYLGKNFRVGRKNNLSSSLSAFSYFLYLRFWLTSLIFLHPKFAIAANFHAQPFRKSVDH